VACAPLHAAYTRFVLLSVVVFASMCNASLHNPAMRFEVISVVNSRSGPFAGVGGDLSHIVGWRTCLATLGDRSGP
jgi:hypothetical protein